MRKTRYKLTAWLCNAALLLSLFVCMQVPAAAASAKELDLQMYKLMYDGTGMKDVRNPKIPETRYPSRDVVVVDYDVTDPVFGAKGDGETDDTAAIQKALDQAFADGGGTVWLPAGTYRITSTLTVYPFCTLRGDWRDPDAEGTGYGTVISADVAQGEWGDVCVMISGSSCVKGLTFYWPKQNMDSPVPYNYAISMPGYNLHDGIGYMLATIEDITLLNAYKGLSLSSTKVDGSEETGNSPHDMTAIRNVKGTVLYRGLVNTNADDHSSEETIYFNSSYWANAGTEYNAPEEAKIKAFTREKGIAFSYGSCEWEMMLDLQCSDYLYGVHFWRNPVRTRFIGEFSQCKLLNCGTAIQVDDGYHGAGRGFQFINSTLEGDPYWMHNTMSSTGDVPVAITNCTTKGELKYDNGDIRALVISKDEAPWYDGNQIQQPKVTVETLYDVTKAPYNAPFEKPQTVAPQEDATPAVQKALDDAGAAGGGVVYLPSGWYRFDGRLNVPANVELRGCMSASREERGGSMKYNGSLGYKQVTGLSYGTVLMAYDGMGTAAAFTAPAFITLNGDNTGVQGIRVFYPENNPDYGIKAYPFTIRGGNHKNMYVVNLGVTGAWNVVDFSAGCDNHYIRRINGTFYNIGMLIGPSASGTIQACHTNIHAPHRSGYQEIYEFPEEGLNYSQYAMADVGDSVVRRYQTMFLIDGAMGEKLHGNGAYMVSTFCKVKSGKVQMMNNVVDNCASWGYHCYAPAKTAEVIMENSMQYNGTIAHGNIRTFNWKLVPFMRAWAVRF